MKLKIKQHPYTDILQAVRKLVEQANEQIAKNINVALLYTYWHTGKLIAEREIIEQYDENSVRQLLLDLSVVMTRDLGKGFSRSQLTYMRLFYLNFPDLGVINNQSQFGVTVSHQKKLSRKEQNKQSGVTVSHQTSKKQKNSTTDSGLTVSHQLSWSHYIELLKCNTIYEIGFYQKAAVSENWSVRELRRQIDSALFERLALSNKATSLKKLAARGQAIKKEQDLIRDPYVLEFLNIPEGHAYNERQLEQKIIDNLQHFILEIGKGFAFINRQFRITLDNNHYYVDLVFYHRILKCFVLIDLKVRGIKHQDIGQMNMYLNYFDTEQNVKGDNPPIGIILGKQKDDITIEYAIKGVSSKIFVSKYQLYLPDKKVLQERVKEVLINQPQVKKATKKVLASPTTKPTKRTLSKFKKPPQKPKTTTTKR